VQIDQLTPDIVQNRNKKLAWRKPKPAPHMRLKANNVGSIDRWKIQGSGGTN
jgi:hypothetical protein